MIRLIYVFIQMPLNHVFRLIIYYQNSEFKTYFRDAAQHFKMYANTEIFNNGYERMLFKEIGFTI